MKNLSTILCKVLNTMMDMYSKDTVEKTSSLFVPESNLLKLQSILEKKPSEEEFLQEIEKLQAAQNN